MKRDGREAAEGRLWREKVRGVREKAGLELEVGPVSGSTPATDEPTTEFLLERYAAFNAWGGTRKRCFEIRHPPWTHRPMHGSWRSADLLCQEFSWFHHCVAAGAHYSPGLTDVHMGAPRTAA